MSYTNAVIQLLYAFYRRLKYLYFNDKSPVVASIKITQRCNLHCSHCTWVNKVAKDLPLSRWKEIIDTLYRRGCGIVFIEGGEPTLRGDLPEIIAHIKSKGMFCVMFTNGTRSLDGLEPDTFWFSIDGTEEQHDRVRGKGTYKKVMDTLTRYPDKNTLSITTLSKVNVDGIEDICRDLSSTSLNGLIFNFMYPYKDVAADVLTRKQRIASAQKILALKEKYKKIASSNSYLRTVGQADKLCYPWILLLVTADGKITQGCTVAPVEEPNCEVCDMMCGLEATLGFELYRDSLHFWSMSKILPQLEYVPDWVLSLFAKIK